MKRVLLTTMTAFFAIAMMFGQSEILINDFTGTIDPDKIYGDSYDTGSGMNESTVSFEDDQLKADYSFDKPSWYPRTVWYHFEQTYDMSEKSILNVKFMATDNENDSLKVRLDLWGMGAEPYNDTIREMMETNGNPWEILAANGEWYDDTTDFEEANRWFCTYWNGGIDATRIDSTQINGFEALVNYGDDELANMPGTLYIDYIKITDELGTDIYLYGEPSAFSLAIYPTTPSSLLKVNSESRVAELMIVDITGKVVYKNTNVNRKLMDIDVSSYNTGLYILNAVGVNGEVVSKKFIKK